MLPPPSHPSPSSTRSLHLPSGLVAWSSATHCHSHHLLSRRQTPSFFSAGQLTPSSSSDLWSWKQRHTLQPRPLLLPPVTHTSERLHHLRQPHAASPLATHTIERPHMDRHTAWRPSARRCVPGTVSTPLGLALPSCARSLPLWRATAASPAPNDAGRRSRAEHHAHAMLRPYHSHIAPPITPYTTIPSSSSPATHAILPVTHAIEHNTPGRTNT
jgi:hypothetical protein